jgi:hypothetical protein
MADMPNPDPQCEVWVQDLTDRNMFSNRQLGLRLSETTLQERKHRLVTVMYDRERVVALPFGYTRNEGGEIIIEGTSAAIVIRIFEYRAQGLSEERIAKRLEGLTLASGIAWTAANVREILRDKEVYKSGIVEDDSSLHLPPILV